MDDRRAEGEIKVGGDPRTRRFDPLLDDAGVDNVAAPDHVLVKADLARGEALGDLRSGDEGADSAPAFKHPVTDKIAEGLADDAAAAAGLRHQGCLARQERIEAPLSSLDAGPQRLPQLVVHRDRAVAVDHSGQFRGRAAVAGRGHRWDMQVEGRPFKALKSYCPDIMMSLVCGVKRDA